MAKDAGKAQKYFKILNEIEKFDDPSYGQRLELITKTLAMSKQNLNYYLRRFVKAGLIEHVQEQPFSIYQITGKGKAVKENLVQSEDPVKTVTWRYHNLIVGYRIFTWGNFRFNAKKSVRMNNWSYQILKAKNGLQAHIQDTGLLKIYGPKLYGPDGEDLRIKASTMVQDAARYFIDHFDLELQEAKVIRKGEKELLGSQQLAKLIGRVKTDEIYVNASGGDENLEEPDDSFAVENILHNLEETPMRLERLESALGKLGPAIETLAQQNHDLARNIELHLGVEQQQLVTQQAQEKTQHAIVQGISDLRAAVKDLSANTQVQTPSEDRDRPATGLSGPQNVAKGGLAAFTGPATQKNIEIQITRETPAFSHEHRGAGRIIGPFLPGAKIWLPEDVALQIISDGYAQRIQEDKAGAE